MSDHSQRGGTVSPPLRGHHLRNRVIAGHRQAGPGKGSAALTDLARIFIELITAYTRGGSLLLLLDFDGTLAPIADDPGDVRLAAEVQEDLQVLARSSRIALGIISGRSVRDLRAKVPIEEAIHAGCHGLEVSGPGLSFKHAGAQARRALLQAIARELEVRVAPIPGALVESKGFAIAVHYRHVAGQDLGRLRSLVERVLRGRQHQVELLRGKKAYEIVPRVRWNKGLCGLWLLDCLQGRLPSPITTLYVGDDQGGERAFRALSGSAVTVRVGSAKTRSPAALRIPTVIDVQGLLSVLADEIGRRVEPWNLSDEMISGPEPR